MSRLDERGCLQLVYVWTHVLSRIVDYYWFEDNFLRIVLQDLLPHPIGRFSQEVIKWMEDLPTPLDYFLGKDFTFIRFHGFPREPFQHPKFVTDRVFALEACYQVTVVNKINVPPKGPK